MPKLMKVARLSYYLGFFCLIPLFSVASTGSVSTVADTEQNFENYQKGMFVVMTGAAAGTLTSAGSASVAVVVDGKVMLFDLGTMAMENLMKVGITPNEIDHVFITHLHIDHVASFPKFLNHVGYGQKTVSINGPRGIETLTDAAARFFDIHLIENVAKGRPDFFNIEKKIVINRVESEGVVFDKNNIRVTAAPTSHHFHESLKSFAYRVDSPYGSVVISGDTAPSLNVVELASNVDLLVHEAILGNDLYEGVSPLGRVDDLLDDELRSERPRRGHTSLSELGKVAQRANAKNLVIYHHTFFEESSSVRKRLKQLLNYKRLFDPAARYDFVDTVKKNYSGPVIIGEPTMVFKISSSQENQLVLTDNMKEKSDR